MAPALLSQSSSPAPPIETIKLSAAQERVIHERRHRLHPVRAIIAGAFAMAEAKEKSSDVRWALEAALETFEAVIERIEPTYLCRDAQTVTHG